MPTCIGAKAVIFTRFKQAVPLVRDLLRKKFGDTAVAAVTLASAKERRDAINLFNDNPECRALVLQAGDTDSGAGAAGLTLTAASHVILLDVLQDPMVELQAIGRVHRIGQKRETNVWHLISRGSVDVLLHGLGDVRREVSLHKMLSQVETLPVHAEVESRETVSAVAVLLSGDKGGNDDNDDDDDDDKEEEEGEEEEEEGGEGEEAASIPAPWRSIAYLNSTVGHRVRVYWDGPNERFSGVITEVNPKNHKVCRHPLPVHRARG